MFWFVLLVATLNLGVGYALGAGWSFDTVLDRLTPRRKAEPDDLAEETPLTKPAPAPATPPPTAAVEPVSEAQPPAEASPQEAPPEETPAQETPPQETKPVPQNPAEVMQGLAAFREQLASTSVELKLSQEDPDRFDECATRLQQCNHDYLEQAEGAIQSLDELSGAGDEVAGATRDAVANGRDKVNLLSEEIDGLIEGEMDEHARSELISKTQQMRDTAERVERTTGTAIQQASPAEPAAEALDSEEFDSEEFDTDEPNASAEPEVEPQSDVKELTLHSIDEVFDRVEQAIQAATDEDPAQLAALKLDPIEGHEDDQPLHESIAAAIARILSETLGETQPFCGGQTTVGLLEGDSFVDAIQRIETVRQRVQATTFEWRGEKISPTVTCALVDGKPGDERDKLTEQLELSLAESERLGANRTYHHDGAFPTPVPEAELSIEPATVSLG